MSVDSEGLGDLLTKMYNVAIIGRVLRASVFYYALNSRLVKLTVDWSVLLDWNNYREMRRRYLHHCPTGDARVIPAKTCHLCQVNVPEAVEFMAICLETEE